MSNTYMAQRTIVDGRVQECPRSRKVTATDCRRKCRFYYGRGIIKFVDNYNQNDPRTPAINDRALRHVRV